MSEFSVSLAKLAEEANLTVAYTPCELEKVMVTATEVYRPGILLAGYYENFDNKRVQIIGLTEMSYWKNCPLRCATPIWKSCSLSSRLLSS